MRPVATILNFTPPMIASILTHAGWAIISAELPWQPLLSAETNRRIDEQRTGHLRRRLSLFSVENYDAIGHYAGKQECSSLILDVDEQSALNLGVMYGQETVLIPRGLLCCKTGACTPALEVVTLRPGAQEDRTHISATGATFAVRYAAGESQPRRETA